MFGALDSGGESVGFLIADLMKQSVGRIYRDYLIQGKLTLVSVLAPDTGVSRWEFRAMAMQRNDYIYCLADASLVAHYAEGQGGKWNGAAKNLKKAWVPLWVPRLKQGTMMAAGGKALLEGNEPSATSVIFTLT